MFKRSFLYLLIASTLLFSGCVIKGRVIDQNGKGVAGVTVNLSGDASMTTTTNSNGYYKFGTLANKLSAGSYTVTTSGNPKPTTSNVSLITQTLEDLGEVAMPVGGVDFTIFAATLEGKVMYNGTPITAYTSETVSFWVRDENTGNAFPATPTYDNTSGAYSIPGLPPGTYSVGVNIDAASPYDGRSFPGDFYGWNSNIIVPSNTDPVTNDLTCSKLLHLISPVDNSSELQYPPPYDTYYQQSILFQWDPVSEASSYDIQVNKYQNSPYQFVETTVNVTGLSGNQSTIILSPNSENDHYEFNLYARNARGSMVGQLMLVYSSGYGWDYRFRVDGN